MLEFQFVIHTCINEYIKWQYTLTPIAHESSGCSDTWSFYGVFMPKNCTKYIDIVCV